MKKILLAFLLFSVGFSAQCQTLDKLSIETIMRDPKWIGTSPVNISWSEDSKSIYFNWNPEGNKSDSLYALRLGGNADILQVPAGERRKIPGKGVYTADRSRKVYEQYGDLYLAEIPSGNTRRLTATTAIESNPAFINTGRDVVFRRGDDLFMLSLVNGSLIQLTDFRQGHEMEVKKPGLQDTWLNIDQTEHFQVLRERKEKKELSEAAIKEDEPNALKPFFLKEQSLTDISVSPQGRFISFKLSTKASVASTIVPKYVTESGYTEDLSARAKVGAKPYSTTFFIQDRLRDSTYALSIANLPGLYDLPLYLKEYPEEYKIQSKAKSARSIDVYGPNWSEDGRNAFVVVYAQDNKDRWIMRLDAEKGTFSLIDRQHDDAWIGGPGITDWSMRTGNAGWINQETMYFQSEVDGFSHIYTYNVNTKKKQQLTKGPWEVQTLLLSKDKQSFYFTANRNHPGLKDFYRMPVFGGEPEQLTTMKGGNEVTLSPDEQYLAIRYSSSNKPWDLYLQENKPGAQPMPVTHSTTKSFESYPWRQPEVISFKNRSGSEVYARLYQPKKPKANKPAVIFVHGAGYLQNAHQWWSLYFREYMFHNLLVDEGYTVLDIDYQGSAGYGRDCRTNIYRHMGGADLNDHVDAAELLVNQYGINKNAIGIYGGSYGGFITLMAMFNQPGVFKAGAALRSVTDWAHYNQGYTSNILNEPANDPKAYERSSPIYFAEGLKNRLLICHGMVDVNVHFQDVVRLSQRLIELGKDNWELAVYPMEDHGFIEPSSWTDEYKRIYKLFEEELN